LWLTRPQQDVGLTADNVRLVKETVNQLGGLDIIVNNAGWTRFSTFGDINDLSHDEWNKVRANIHLGLFIDGISAGPPTSCPNWF